MRIEGTTQKERDWEAIEKRARAALDAAGINVVVVDRPVKDRRKDDNASSAIAALGYSSICFKVPVTLRSHAAKVIEEVLGPDFVARFHKHPKAVPQDVVFLFPKDRAWPDETFTSSNVQRGRYGEHWAATQERNRQLLAEIRKKVDQLSADEIHAHLERLQAERASRDPGGKRRRKTRKPGQQKLPDV